MFKCLAEQLKSFSKEDLYIFIFTLFFGILVYINFITNGLTNTADGLWNGTYYYAGRNEISSGRWLWYIIDRCIQGVKVEPFVSITSLCIFSLGNVVLIETIGIRKGIVSYLLSFSIISSTTLCCMLSYTHQSYMFALSYFFACVGAYAFIKINNSILSIVYSSAFVILTLASYQSQIGCFCLLVIICILIENLTNNYDFNKNITTIMKFCAVIVISCAVYKMVWDILMHLGNIGASTYKAAGSITIKSIVINTPKNIESAYCYFLNFYSGLFFTSIYPSVTKILICLLLGLLFLCFIKINTCTYKNKLWCTFLILILPVMCNFTMLIIDAGITLQQTMPISIVLPTLIAIVLDGFLIFSSKFKHVVSTLTYFAFVLFVFGNTLATEMDIEAMRQGKVATEALIRNVCEEIVSDGYYNDNEKYYFYGLPCENDLFNVNEIWYLANDYAKLGKFGLNAWVTPVSYQGIINNIGYNLHCNFSSNQKFNDFINEGIVDKMNCYPNEGSIKKVEGGYTLIKISNSY